ncbi:PilN domain-containing protein [Anaeromusa acidaminophila]|uniref:PilN domain-containing protein n=1 Tax=Anaeromusa acidaminophila TaxID=81464 RepID=UPI00037BD649|nr:PilN domain-containing protein [Anaeromusa acidaminophila]
MVLLILLSGSVIAIQKYYPGNMTGQALDEEYQRNAQHLTDTQKRIDILQKAQLERRPIVLLMEEVILRRPDGVWLTKVEVGEGQKSGSVVVEGFGRKASDFQDFVEKLQQSDKTIISGAVMEKIGTSNGNVKTFQLKALTAK